jgi:excisionase family DNA binding protein
MATKDLLTPGQVATLFGVSAGTVVEWADSGKLAYFRTPGGHRRFRRSAVDTLLASLERSPEAVGE